MIKKTLCAWLAAEAGLGALHPHAADSDKGITVFAAASLTNVLQDLGDAFTKDTSIPVRFSFAASSALARQIENGSHADMFFSADLEWMDYLQARNLIQASARHDLLGNQLVLIAPVDSTINLKTGPPFALAAAIGGSRLATGDPDSVPVGRYAHEALAYLGVWDEIAPRLVRADSVRSALAFVDRGDAGHRLCDRCLGRQESARGRRIPREKPSADHLSRGVDRGIQAGGGQISGLHSRTGRGSGVQALRLHAAALNQGLAGQLARGSGGMPLCV